EAGGQEEHADHSPLAERGQRALGFRDLLLELRGEALGFGQHGRLRPPPEALARKLGARVSQPLRQPIPLAGLAGALGLPIHQVLEVELHLERLGGQVARRAPSAVTASKAANPASSRTAAPTRAKLPGSISRSRILAGNFCDGAMRHCALKLRICTTSSCSSPICCSASGSRAPAGGNCASASEASGGRPAYSACHSSS